MLYLNFEILPKVIESNNLPKLYSNYFVIIIFSFWFVNSIKHLVFFIKENSKMKPVPQHKC